MQTKQWLWSYATRLYDAELNVRWELCPRVTMLAGFRWVGLWEDLQGNLASRESDAFLGHQDEE